MVSWFRPRSFSRALRVTLCDVLVAIVLASVAAVPAEAVEDYAIVVSPDVAVTSINVEQLRRLFLFREKYWKPGRPVKLIFSEDGLEPSSFLLERIYRSDYPSLRRLIVEKLYQDEIDLAPKVVATDEVAAAFVASGRGLIALVRANAVHGTNAKVVAIDGILPGASGYALRR